MNIKYSIIRILYILFHITCNVDNSCATKQCSNLGQYPSLVIYNMRTLKLRICTVTKTPLTLTDVLNEYSRLTKPSICVGLTGWLWSSYFIGKYTTW